ncbi:MAG: cheR [Bacteroidota bacterium]|nr:cheR [Bacteroidota bacterium]
MEFEKKELQDLLEAIRAAHGYDFTEYADASVRRRIAYFMNNHKIETLEMLEKILLKEESVFETFIQGMSVSVTEMFRDPSFYKSLRENVIGRLSTYPFIKIWIAGCATGEEVYSMAILFKEEGLLNRTLIYATDINQKSLQAAKEGVYPLENMKAYTGNYQKSGGRKAFSEYYKAKYNSVLFDKSLRENVVFSPHNLSTDRSFNEFQLIVCRNVLIYFNQQLQGKVINLFYDSLCPFGFLGLGSKESLLFSTKKNFFDEVDRKEKIFRKSRLKIE